MTALVSHNRALAWHFPLRRARKGGAGNTTDRWQDKGARCVRLFGRVLSRGYVTNSRGVLDKRSLRQQRYGNKFNSFTRCAGLLT
jgi:hypothetical protein